MAQFLLIAFVVALFYFPAIVFAEKIGGEKLQTFVIVILVVIVLSLITGIPLAFYLFLRYGLV